ncbi:MAG: Polyketide cyclase/dehydrase [Actinomycetia bacterium]|nr:Polyketide cyclase/dehydrase [Actinomycetes bacterium]
MRTCSYEVTARSAAPPERVFDLLADATSWPRWAGLPIAHGSWEREGEPAPRGVGAIRKVGRWPMFGREQVVASEPPSHHAYTMLSGNPVRHYRADVLLAPDGVGTSITWSATFEPLIPGTGRLFERIYQRLIGSFARRLAAYAEQPTNRRHE